MNHLTILNFTFVGMLWGGVFADRIHASTGDMPQITTVAAQTSSTAFPLQYKNGLIEADVKNISLGRVLELLALKTGALIKLNDPAIASCEISVFIDGIRIKKSIKKILDGFSYIFYPVDNSFTLIVLSTDSIPTRKCNKWTESKSKHAKKYTDPVAYSGRGDTPQSLGEFRSTTKDPLSCKGQEENLDPYTQAATTQENQEALLFCAINALNSDSQYLREEALNELANIDDPLATQVLVEAANTDEYSISRSKVVDALWRHAVNLQFTDAATIDSLEHLALDDDDNVSGIAQRALLEMQSYKQRNSVH